MSTSDNATTSVSLRSIDHDVFSDAGTKKHQCPGLNLVANATTSLALCGKVSVFAFHCPFGVVDQRNDMILSSTDSGFCPFRYF